MESDVHVAVELNDGVKVDVYDHVNSAGPRPSPTCDE